MFLSPADRVAPAPRMSWAERELKSLKYSRRLVAMSVTREGIPVVRIEKSSKAWRILIAEAGRMYF